MLTGPLVDGRVLVAIISGCFIHGQYYVEVLNMIPYVRHWLDNPNVSVKDNSSIKFK